MAYERLFTPFDLGHVRLRNRIAMMPHAVVFPGGYGPAVDRVIDYHVERARGGAALIVMSNFLMPPSWRRLADWGGALETMPLGSLDLANDTSLRPNYRRLIDAVHEEGAAFVSQLNASGRQLRSPGTSQFGIPLFAPPPLACPRAGEIPKEMTRAEIAEYVETMVETALNLQAAGGDGVELFAAQGYLLHEFLSPSTNWREDDYGGSLENRARFLVEAIRAIRAAAGPDFLIGVRMNGADYVPGGLEVDDCTAIARRLAAEPIAYLNVSGRTSLTYPGWIADVTVPEAQFAGEAAAIRAAVPGMPVCVSSRITTPALAESILAGGGADLIGLARALISDPEWPRKAMAGDTDDIRLCTYSNQSCIVGLDRGKGVGCLHNVAVGRERQLGIAAPRPPAKRPRRVAVVGGGPAGMAAARVAAERGHAVTLFEADAELGGQVRLIARVPSAAATPRSSAGSATCSSVAASPCGPASAPTPRPSTGSTPWSSPPGPRRARAAIPRSARRCGNSPALSCRTSSPCARPLPPGPARMSW
jgi:2,4-dienoyl-CoA reductase-like NADH-dependent reductase (Old Yellow Enzyme family)